MDMQHIRRRTLGHPNGPGLSDLKWQTAPLITPRNTIWQAWNNQAAIRHCIQTGNQIFISPSIDEGLPCTREAMIWAGDNKTDMLATWNVLCIGAEAIVTSNLAVKLNVANRSKVIIKEVVPHPEDHQGWREIQHNAVVKLSHPPITVFVEPIPISGDSPSECNYHPHHCTCFPISPIRQCVKIPREFCVSGMKTFYRTQIPLTLGLSLSDFRVQGNGLTNAILDMKRPPTGPLGLENVYVMLSHISSWEGLAILRPFEDGVLQGVPDQRCSRPDSC